MQGHPKAFIFQHKMGAHYQYALQEELPRDCYDYGSTENLEVLFLDSNRFPKLFTAINRVIFCFIFSSSLR